MQKEERQFHLVEVFAPWNLATGFFVFVESAHCLNAKYLNISPRKLILSN